MFNLHLARVSAFLLTHLLIAGCCSSLQAQSDSLASRMEALAEGYRIIPEDSFAIRFLALEDELNSVGWDNTTLNPAYYWFCKGSYFVDEAKYDGALEGFQTGISYSVKTDSAMLPELYERTAWVMGAVGRFEEGIRLAQSCLALDLQHLAESKQDTSALGARLFNDLTFLMKFYQTLGKLDSAEYYFYQSDTYINWGSESTIDNRNIFWADLHRQKGDYDTAFELYKSNAALKSAKEDKLWNYLSIGRLLETSPNKIYAKFVIDSATTLLEVSDRLDYRELYYLHSMLAEMHEFLGNYEEAYAFALRYMNYKDSMEYDAAAFEAEQMEAEIQYQSKIIGDSIANENKQKVIAAELESEQARTEQTTQLLWFAVIVLMLIALLAALLFSRNKSIKKKKEQLDHAYGELAARNQEKEVLLKEIHHRVKNNLQVISSLLDLQSDAIEDEIALSAVSDGQNRVRAMSLIHEKLYQTEDITSLNFKSYTENLFRQIAASFGDSSVSVSVESEEIELDIDTSVPLGLIQNELITNAFKYAFPDTEHKQIQISLHRKAPGLYQMIFRDNGVGLPEGHDFVKSRTLGLKLVRRLSMQLGGEAVYKYDQGALFTIDFKDTTTRNEED